MLVTMDPVNAKNRDETVAVLADEALMRQLAESEADIAAGRVEDLETLSAAMHARAERSVRSDLDSDSNSAE